jgi:hypothetical protein
MSTSSAYRKTQYTVRTFILCIIDGPGAVVHSYGRLIFHERVITDRHQLQPPNNDNGDGRIACGGGKAKFTYYGIKAPTNPLILSVDVFKHFKNTEGMCHRIYHHLFLSNGK